VFCVEVQLASRDSSGCDELMVEGVVLCERRRVSGRPGADGAPGMRTEVVSLVDCVLVVVVLWEAAGVMRRED